MKNKAIIVFIIGLFLISGCSSEEDEIIENVRQDAVRVDEPSGAVVQEIEKAPEEVLPPVDEDTPEPEIKEEPVEEPEVKETPKVDSDCLGNTYNCGDFSSYSQAKAMYDKCGGISNDVHQLDRDKDEIPCESLQ